MEYRVVDVEEQREGEGEAVELELPGVGVQAGEEGGGQEEEDVEAERGQDAGPGGEAVAQQHVHQVAQEVGPHRDQAHAGAPELV